MKWSYAFERERAKHLVCDKEKQQTKKDWKKNKAKITVKQWQHRFMFGVFTLKMQMIFIRVEQCYEDFIVQKLQLELYFSCALWLKWHIFLMHIFASFWRTILPLHTYAQTKHFNTPIQSLTDNVWHQSNFIFGVHMYQMDPKSSYGLKSIVCRACEYFPFCLLLYLLHFATEKLASTLWCIFVHHPKVCCCLYLRVPSVIWFEHFQKTLKCRMLAVFSAH